MGTDEELQAMREELAMYAHWGTDYPMESCRRDVDELTDGQVYREWLRMNTAWTAPRAVSDTTRNRT